MSKSVDIPVRLDAATFRRYCAFDAFSLLQGITAEDCRRFVAETLVPERLAMAVVAPKKGEAEG